jgi:plasmid stabilization system protein ParE
MAQLRYTTSARRDIVSITVYIADRSGSRVVAERFAGRLRGKCRDIAKSPIRLGRPRPTLLPDIRSLTFGNYMIFFQYVGDTVEITNVIEGHRDLEALFRKKDE